MPALQRLVQQQKRVKAYADAVAAARVAQARVEYARVCCIYSVMAGFCVVVASATFRLSLAMCRYVTGVRVAPDM